MSKTIEVGEGFWNVRGSFRVGGLLDVGTHMSLVRLASGRYVLLDACGLDPEVRRFIDERTNGGAELAAIVHLHPFHTVHVRAAHEAYPKAKLYGTARHKERFDGLPWEAVRSDDAAMNDLFAGDLEFSVPRGVDFIPAKPNLHFSSVLAFHGASKTLHVDDTLCFVRLPWVLRPMGRDLLGFHPTLAKVLERRAGAAGEFREWGRNLVSRASTLENICTAHVSTLLGRKNTGASIEARVESALAKVEGKLAAHEKKYG